MTQEWAPPGIDVSKPSIARVYDACLGGKDNFAIDRAVHDELVKVIPQLQNSAVANRMALGRGVAHLAGEAGITQFLDLGSGLPSKDNTHQVALRHNPEARVAYVDNDPIVLAHGRAMLSTGDHTTVVTADLANIEGVLYHPDVRRLLDFSEPVAVLLLSMLHHFRDQQNPAGIVKAYMDAVPSGSYLFVTHFCKFGPEAIPMEHAFLKHLGSGRFRTMEQIDRYFNGLEMVDPGLVHLPLWRPEEPLDRDLTPDEKVMAGGIGRKP